VRFRRPFGRRRLAVAGVVALAGLGGVVVVTRPSGRGRSAVEVQASGAPAPGAAAEPPGGPPAVDDPLAHFGPPSVSSTAPGPSSSSSSSSSSTTSSGPVTVPTRLPAPTTTTTVMDCASASPVYVFGLDRRPDGSGWAAGGNPALQRSTDGGLTWTPACLPAGAVTGAGALYGVVFDAVQRYGWAVGGSGGHPVVFRTVDGGDHWLTGRVPDGIAGTLMDVEFPDDTHGWAVGPLTGNGPANASGGVVLATTDGGATWVTQAVPAGIGRLSRASFVDPAHGWAVGMATGGQPVLIATTDGGATWANQTLPAGIRELRDVGFLDGRTGWAVGALPVPLPAEPGKDDPGVILTTVDRGTTWTQQATTVGSLWSLQVIDGQTLFAGGGYGLFSTHDGGGTWAKQAFTLPALDAVSFSDATHGWVSHSMFSVVCRTDDGGRTWVGSDVRGGYKGSACTSS